MPHERKKQPAGGRRRRPGTGQKAPEGRRETKTERSGRSPEALSGWSVFGNRATLISLAIIVGVGLFYFRRVIFGGEILTGGDVLAGAAIFEDYATKQIANGHLPLWNPYIFSGMPFLESMTWNGIVYPNYWIRRLLESVPGVALPRLFFLVLHYILAGVGTFFFLRSRKVGHAGATIAGVAFMLSPHLVGLAAIGHGGKVLSAAYIPLVLLAAFRLLETGQRRWIGILATVGGLQFLARHVQVSYYTWLAVGLVLVFYLISARRDGTRPGVLFLRAGQLLSAGVLAATLAAVLLLPLINYSDLSTRVAENGGMGFAQATMWSFHPAELGTFLVPSILGLSNETYWGTMPFQQVSHYVGYVVLALAAIAVFRKRDRDVRFLLILAAAGIFLSFGRHIGPVYRIMYDVLPGFSRFRVPALFLLLSQFSLAALAGHGAGVLLGERNRSEILSRKRESGTGEGGWLRWAIGTAAVGMGVGVMVMLFHSSIEQAASASLMAKHTGVAASALRQVGVRAATLATRDAGILLAFAAATGVVIFVASTRKLARWIVALLLLGLIVWDLSTVNARFVHPEPMRPLSTYFRETPAITYLKQQPGVFRVAPLGQSFSSNEWMYHGIESIGGYHPAKLQIYDRLMDGLGVATLKFFALTNVRYLVGPEEDIGHAAFLMVAPGVHENLAAMERVFLMGSAKVVQSENLALGELGTDGFNPAAYAIVDRELPGPVEDVGDSKAELVSYSAERIVVTAEITRPCLLVFSELYYPRGWKAFVNDEETSIYRTNYAFRSVYLEPGKHTVVMAYTPEGLRAGLVVTVLSALVIALLWALPVRDGKRRETK